MRLLEGVGLKKIVMGVRGGKQSWLEVQECRPDFGTKSSSNN